MQLDYGRYMLWAAINKLRLSVPATVFHSNLCENEVQCLLCFTFLLLCLQLLLCGKLKVVKQKLTGKSRDLSNDVSLSHQVINAGNSTPCRSFPTTPDACCKFPKHTLDNQVVEGCVKTFGEQAKREMAKYSLERGCVSGMQCLPS